MFRILTAITVITLLALPGCSDNDPTGPPTDPPTEVIPIDRITKTDAFMEATLDVFLIRQGSYEWLSVVGEARNHTEQTLMYDTGGCGCPNPDIVERDGEGRSCSRPGPLCPCWYSPREIAPGDSLSAGGPVEGFCRGESPVHEVAFWLGYSVPAEDGWAHRSIEVSYVLPPDIGSVN